MGVATTGVATGELVLEEGSLEPVSDPSVVLTTTGVATGELVLEEGSVEPVSDP